MITINVLLLKNLINLHQKILLQDLKQANLACKNYIANFVKNKDFDNKLDIVTSYENELDELSKKVKGLSSKKLTKDLRNKFSILNGAKCLSSGIFQNYLVFIPARKNIKYFSGTTWIDFWKSNPISKEQLDNITKSESNFARTFVNYHVVPDINFNVPFLIINIHIPEKVINLYLPYKLNPHLRTLNTDLTLDNWICKANCQAKDNLDL